MTLLVLPDYKETVILCGTTVRKDLPVLQAYLQSLEWQDLPKRHRLAFAFVPDFTPEQQDAQEYLFRWVNERGGTLIEGVPSPAGDFSDGPQYDAHQWSQSAMARVGQNKDRILQYARDSKADYLFFCDSDVVLDTTTVASLLSAEKPIATAVYWTRWASQTNETSVVPAAPQVWLQHPYTLSGRGMDEAEFRGKLINRELVRVPGYGACTLLNQRVIESGVGFAYLPGVSTDGLMAGEDRHFCLSAERRHIDAWADSWPDVFHIYRGSDHARIPEMLARLGQPHPRLAGTGDQVSLRLRPLEPLQVGVGRLQQLPVVMVRGRLGALPLSPELEEAVHTIERGSQRIVQVHMPIHHPFPQFRGRSRLIELTVVDVKRHGYAPVVEQDLHVGLHSGRYTDGVVLTPAQRERITA